VETNLGSSSCTTNFRKGRSVLKKWLSAQSAVQEGPKTRRKRYENGAFGPWIGGAGEPEGVFQHAGRLAKLRRIRLLGSSDRFYSPKFRDGRITLEPFAEETRP
jgi:hypothetical protein